jgi:hypothetical protein
MLKLNPRMRKGKDCEKMTKWESEISKSEPAKLSRKLSTSGIDPKGNTGQTPP